MVCSVAKPYYDAYISQGHTHLEASRKASEALGLGNQYPTSLYSKKRNREAYTEGSILFNRMPITPEATLNVFDQLGSLGNVVDPIAHTNHLRDVLSGLVNPVLGNFNNIVLNLRESVTSAETLGELQQEVINLVAANKNYVPPTSLEQSTQETFVEEIVHHVLRDGLKNPQFSGISNKLLESARKQLNDKYDGEGWKVFMPDTIPYNSTTQIEEHAAKEQWEYVFASKNALDEFMTKGIVNDKFKSILSELTYQIDKNKAPERISDKIISIWNKVVDWILGYVLRVDVGAGKQRLENISMDKAVYGLGLKISRANEVYSKLAQGNKYINSANNFISDKVFKKIGNTVKPYFRSLAESDSMFNTIGKLGFTVSVYMSLNNEQMSKEKETALAMLYRGINEVKLPVLKQLNNLLLRIPIQMIGTTDKFEPVYMLLREAEAIGDRSKREVYSNMLKYINDSFKTKITPDDEVALTYGLLRTGVYKIASEYDITEIYKEGNAEKEIDALVKEFNQFGKNGNNYIKQAQSLAAVSMGYSPTIGNTMLNVGNIVNGVYEGDSFEMVGDQAKAIELTYKLVSLFSISYLEPTTKAKVDTLINNEFNADKENNGINAIMGQAQAFYIDSLTNIFKDDPSQLTDNYIRETTYNKYDIRYGTLADRDAYEKEGFELHGKVGKDKADSFNVDLYEYRAKGVELDPMVRGAMSLIDTKEKGSSIYEKASLLKLENAGRKAAVVNARMRKYYTLLSKRESNQAPNLSLKPTYDSNYAIPKVENGEIVEYRYIDNDQVKNAKLHRDSRASHVLARMFSRRVDEVESARINKEVSDFLIKDAANYESDKSNFILLSPDSEIEDYVDAFKLIPSLARKQLSDTIKEYKGIPVRRELVDTIFGYRKPSFKRGTGIAMFDNFITEIVGMAKHYIVIKSGMAIANYFSNQIQLGARGIPQKYSFTKQKEAWMALKQYKRYSDKLNEVRLQLNEPNLSVSKKTAYLQEVNRLEAILDRNPIMSLIDMGYLSTIVEDIDTSNTIYRPGTIQSYYSKFRETLDEKAPKVVGDAFNEVMMNENTWMYKSMDALTKYGDFVSRYVYYSWLLEPKNLQKVPDMALDTYSASIQKHASRLRIAPEKLQGVMKKVREEYVDYSLKKGKEIEALEDRFFTYFISYALRIPKILLDILKNTPASAMSIFLIADYLNVTYPADFSYNVGTPVDALSAFDVYGLNAYLGMPGVITDPLVVLR